MSARETVQQIIELDERIADLREQFEQFPASEKEGVLLERHKEMTAGLEEEAEVPLGLVRIAEMLIDLGGEKAALLFSAGLGHANADVRLLSGDALMHLAEEGIDAIMPAIEDALKDGGLRAEEMPFLLVDIDSPDVPRVLERFLKQDRVEVVASAVEALAEYGDPASLPALKKLQNDRRVVPADDDLDRPSCTLGQLALEAIEMISEAGD